VRSPVVILTLFSLFLAVVGCEERDGSPDKFLLAKMPSDKTGVDFVNALGESDDFNIIEYTCIFITVAA
jgi:hypothetical protein